MEYAALIVLVLGAIALYYGLLVRKQNLRRRDRRQRRLFAPIEHRKGQRRQGDLNTRLGWALWLLRGKPVIRQGRPPRNQGRL